MRNKEFIENIIRNNGEIQNCKCGNLSFSNYTLFSYNEPILKIDNGDFKIFGKTKQFGNFLSLTTSKHINLLINLLEDNHFNFMILRSDRIN